MTETERPASAVPAPREPLDIEPAEIEPGTGAPTVGVPVERAAWDRSVPRFGSWIVVSVIAAVAGVAYGWNANSDGVEAYYAGAVRTMSHSWRAFFFGAFDPAGTISLDKLPGSFWLQSLVIRAFGLHTWCFIAPQIAAGVGTVLVMFVAVRRLAGPRTGVLAAAITAALPATAVMSRGNTADAISVLLMVLAAATATKAIVTGRLRTLILAGAWIGLAFQAKMIEAWAVVPALGLAYMVAAPGPLRRRCGRAIIAGLVSLVISLSWMTAVSLVPAADRPYVDGSTGNSVFQQVFEYNGVHRFDRTGGAYGLARSLPYTPTPAATAYTNDVRDELIPTASLSDPGVFRLVRGPVGRDVGWLLPVALAWLVALLVATRRRPRTDIVRAGALMWGLWLVTFAFIFSNATELQSYYTGVLAPPIAALCALGTRTVYRSRSRVVSALGPALALAAGAAVTPLLLRAVPAGFAAAAIGALVVAAVGVAAGLAGPARLRRSGAIVTALALLVAPVSATVWLVANHGGSFDAPMAPGGTVAQMYAPTNRSAALRPIVYGGVVMPTLNAHRWAGLRTLGAGVARGLRPGHRLVVFTSAEAADYVLAGAPGIEAIGGYSGLVNEPTLAVLRAQLAAHEIDFAIVPGFGELRSADPRVQLIESSCTLIAGGDDVSMAPLEYDCVR